MNEQAHSPPYVFEEFARHILSDIAVRVRDGQSDRITYRGNHVWRHIIFPERDAHETKASYTKRVAAFLKNRRPPRGSDFSLRLAMAFEALRRAGYKQEAAAQFIDEAVGKAVAASKQMVKRFDWPGLPYKVIQPPLGTTQRHLRRSPGRKKEDEKSRRRSVIRVAALRYKRNHAEFRAVFEMELNVYRGFVRPDSGFLLQAAKDYQEKLHGCERELGLYHSVTINMRMVLGDILHQLGEFEEAKRYYRDALKAVEGAGCNVERDETAIDVIELLRKQIARCEASEPPAPWYAPSQLRKMAHTQS